MASGFPGSIDNFTDPLSNSSLSSPSHSGLHSDVNDAIEKIETYMGLVHITTQTFSGATQVDFLNVFSSLYNSYRVVFHYWTATVGENHFFRLRDSGGIVSTVTYNTMRMEGSGGQTVIVNQVGSGLSTTWFPTYINSGATSFVSGYMDIFRPNETTAKAATGQFMRNDSGTMYVVQFAGHNSTTTAMTGFSLVRNVTATMSGKVSVFGYRV